MGIVPTSFRRGVTLSILILSAMLPPAVLSQTQSAAPPPAVAPQPVQFQNPIAGGQLAFVSGYAGRTTKN